MTSTIQICSMIEPNCGKPYVEEESVAFLDAIKDGIPEDAFEFAFDKVSAFCVDCCMRMLTETYEIYFKRNIDVIVTEELVPMTKEEYITSLEDDEP